MRLFVAVDPSPAVRAEIDKALPELRRRAPSAKWVKTGSMHLTLFFLGEVEDARLGEITAAMEDAARGHAPLELHFRGGGAFGGRTPRVLWGGVEGEVEALRAVHRSVTEALVGLGFPKEERPYSPHLTLARAREGRGDVALKSCVEVLAQADFGATRIEEVVVYKSDLGPGGSRYTAMGRAKLSGG